MVKVPRLLLKTCLVLDVFMGSYNFWKPGRGIQKMSYLWFSLIVRENLKWINKGLRECQIFSSGYVEITLKRMDSLSDIA